VQYYTLQGSYQINKYLRNLVNYGEQNEYLENIIKPMWGLVREAPAFDKSYILYRFITEDAFLAHLKVGDIYTEKGFMSTTRDPFYKPDEFTFGSILIKIRIPGNKKGVGLCLETVSHFPKEQEIIFPPKTNLKLINKDTDCVYHDIDEEFTNKIVTKYEFEWIDSEPISFMNKIKMEKLKEIDFLKLNRTGYNTLYDNIISFIKNNTNKMKQFISIVGKSKFTTQIEMFNSTTTYNKFYAMDIPDGFSIYSFYDNYILFFIEIGTTKDNIREMHVNYYTKYSALEKDKIINDEDFILFISSIAYYFDIGIIAIYAEYKMCENDEINENMDYGSYCVDIHNYITKKTKRYDGFGALNIELKPKFTYSNIDMLYVMDAELILNKKDNDEMYQTYDKIFKVDNSKRTVIDFYRWILKNKCSLLDSFIIKLNRIFVNGTNPFLNDVYILDPATFLYNRKLIKIYPSYNNVQIQIKRNIISE
jgi:hypothetical protein